MGPSYARCYLCRERRPVDQTEVTRYRVPSAARGGVVQGVNRYVRMCRVGTGCKRTVEDYVPGHVATSIHCDGTGCGPRYDLGARRGLIRPLGNDRKEPTDG